MVMMMWIKCNWHNGVEWQRQGRGSGSGRGTAKGAANAITGNYVNLISIEHREAKGVRIY